MKKCVFALCILICLFSVTAVHAEDTAMKLEMNGEVKPAKDIGTGKGVYFTLPDLDDPDFYIKSIELAVFEKEPGGGISIPTAQGTKRRKSCWKNRRA